MQFYVTERGELAYQLKRANDVLKVKYRSGDALLAISKNADNEKLHEFLLQHQAYTIFHATITGFGGSMAEPGAPKYQDALQGIQTLIDKGFPAEQIVLRIDPIIPTDKGINLAKVVLQQCPENIQRIRFSFIDGYKNIKGYLPWNSFHAPQEQQMKAMEMLYELQGNRSLEACGEPQLKENMGCISPKDYEILGLPVPAPSLKGQRKGCLCLGNKQEILTKPQKCPNGCIYCYYNLG